MQISAQALFTAIKEDPKQAKALVKSASTPDLLAAKGGEEKLITQKGMENANKVLDKLFNKLANGGISKEQAVKTVQNSAIFKSDTVATTDMKNLVALAQKEPKLSKFLAPLKDFIKHVSTSNGENLKTQVAKSGIGLESKLLSQSNPPKLPNDIKAILNQIVKNQSPIKSLDTPIKEKIVELAKNLLNAKETFKEDIKTLRQEVSNLIKNSPQPKTSLPIKNLMKTLDRLEMLVEAKEIKEAKVAKEVVGQRDIKDSPKVAKDVNISNQIVKESPKEQIAPKQNISNPTTAIDKKIQNTIKELVSQLSSIKKGQIPPEKLAKLESLTKEIQVLEKSLDAKPLNNTEKQLLKTISTQATQATQVPQATQNIQITMPTQDTSLNVQDKLKMMVSKLKQSIEIMDKSAFKVSEGHKAGKEILKTIDRNLQNLPSKPTSEGQTPIKQDVKQSLINIKEASANQSSQNMKDINSIATKTLTNIEANQLISYANNSINTYVPYMWEGLKEGNVAFKSGRDDSFYCQIDLNLKFYGRVNMMLMLTNDSYISLSISTEKDGLKDKIEENMGELKKSLSKMGLIPLHVKFKPFENGEKYSEEWGDFSMNLKV